MKKLSPRVSVELLRRKRIESFHGSMNGSDCFKATIRFAGGAIIPFAATDEGIEADVTPSRQGKVLGPTERVRLKL